MSSPTRSYRYVEHEPVDSDLDFEFNLAYLIGIDNYANGIPRLATAVHDVRQLADVLAEKHAYTVELLTEGVTLGRLQQLFAQTLPAQIQSDKCRVLIYFAGHGIALDGGDGPAGYLIPQDAAPDNRLSFLPMREVNDWLVELPCRHLLFILDCCFAGAFSWTSTRAVRPLPEVLYRERFDRFLRDPAWQFIGSSAYNQSALDTLAGGVHLGQRADPNSKSGHSPFAAALLNALTQSEDNPADLIPKGQGNGVITASELALYLRNEVEQQVEAATNLQQTPNLWPFKRHRNGEFVFLVPEYQLALPSAPELTKATNPWRGLESYSEEHAPLFFGRTELTHALVNAVMTSPLTVVVGPSGAGKTSLVNAGLLPLLRPQALAGATDPLWLILPSIRPTATPLRELAALLAVQLATHDGGSSNPTRWQDLAECKKYIGDSITKWCNQHPQQTMLLIIDRLEEVVALHPSKDERAQFEEFLAETTAGPTNLRIVLLLRDDFEAHFVESELGDKWHRFAMRPLDLARLRDVVEGPASHVALYFDPPDLVDRLIEEANQRPGALPLLSFTLSELFYKYLERQSAAQKIGETLDRSLIQADYDQLGGVIGSLSRRANEIYAELDEARKQTMERIMLRMVAIDGGGSAGRRVPRAELDYPSPAQNRQVDTVIEKLVAARIVVQSSFASGAGQAGQAYIELAHDTLFNAWPSLVEWRRAADDYLLLQRRLTQAATEWEGADEKSKPGLLWNDDPRLPLLQRVLSGDTTALHDRSWYERIRQSLWPSPDVASELDWLNRLEISFIQTSVARQAALLRRIIGTTMAVIVALALLTLFALVQRNQAVRNADAQAAAAATAEYERIRADQNAAAEVQAAATAAAAEATAQAEAVNAQNQAEIAATRAAEAQAAERLAVAGQNAARAQGYLAPGESAGSLPLQHAIEAVLTTLTIDDFVTDDADAALRHAVDDVNWRMVLPRARHVAGVTDLALSDDGVLVASASTDHTVRLWNTESGEQAHLFQGHDAAVISVAFHPDGRQLISLDQQAVTYLWDARTGDLIRQLPTLESAPRVARYSPDGKSLALGDSQGAITLWDTATYKVSRVLLAHDAAVTELSFAPDNRRLASIGEDRIGKVWSLETGQQLLALPGKMVNSIAFSPDGAQLAAATEGYGIWIGDAASGRQQRLLPGHVASVLTVTFSPDGEELASTSQDGFVKVWQLHDGAERLVYAGHARAGSHPRRAIFSPDGSKVVSGGDDRMVRVWERTSGSTIQVWAGHEHSVFGVAYSPDGALLASGSRDQTVRLWGSADGRQLRVLTGHHDNAEAVVFSPSGEILASGGEDALIQLWDPRTGDKLLTLQGSDAPIRSLAFRPDGAQLASGSDDHTIRLWDVQTGEQTLVLTGTELVAVVAFHPNRMQVASVGGDEVVHLWDLASGQELASLEGPQGPLRAVAISPDGALLAGAGQDRIVWVWDWNTQQLLRTFQGHTAVIRSLSFSPSGELLASAGDDTTIRLWNARTGEAVRVLRGHTARVQSVTFSPDGETLASGSGGDSSGNYTIRLWNVKTLAERSLLTGHNSIVRWAEFSPHQNFIATTSDDHLIRLWQAESGELIQALPGHEDRVRTVSFSSDERFMVSAGDDRRIRLWDMETRAITRTLTGHGGWVRSAFFSPDDRYIVSASEDRTVRLWQANSGQLIHLLQGHQGIVTFATFSPDGRLIASTGFDGVVRIWETATGQELHTLPAPSQYVNMARFSPDGALLAAGTGDAEGDHAIVLWDTQTWQIWHRFAARGPVRAVAFSHSGNCLLAVGAIEPVRLWDLTTHRLLRNMTEHLQPGWHGSFSPDDRFFITASEDETARVWFTNIDDLLNVASAVLAPDPFIFTAERRSSLLAPPAFSKSFESSGRSQTSICTPLAPVRPEVVSEVVPGRMLDTAATPVPVQDRATPVPAETVLPPPTETLPAPHPTPVATWVEGVSGAIFVKVPAGEFRMGSTEADIDQAVAMCREFNSSDACRRVSFEDEAPQHPLDLADFWIMQTEVSNAQYRLFFDDGGYDDPRWWTKAGWAWRSHWEVTQPDFWDDPQWNQDAYPVVGVSWYESDAYGRWLSAKTGVKISLPSEAQWEKAARGPAGCTWPWCGPWDGTRLNYCDADCSQPWHDATVNDGYAGTAPVNSYGAHGASPYGAWNMAGNVSEWVRSRYDIHDPQDQFGDNGIGDYPFDAQDGREDPEGVFRRVIRGGTWAAHHSSIRTMHRRGQEPGGNSGGDPQARFTTGGFRLVAILPATNHSPFAVNY
jgi:WD40 repeat protein/formylglycine-generating enzyme required for sulfatase activity